MIEFSDQLNQNI